MKKFIVKIFIFILCVVGFDQLFRIFNYPEANVFEKISREKTEMLVSKQLKNLREYNCIFLGSSHVQLGINPAKFDSITGFKSFNLGIGGGTNICFQEGIVNYIFDSLHCTPAYIIYGIDVFSPNLSDGDFTSENVFAPPKLTAQDRLLSYSNAFKYSDGIKKYFNSLFKFGIYQLPINRKAEDNIEMFHEYKGYKILDNGYIQGFGSMNTDYIRYENMQFIPNEKAKKALERIIKKCTKQKCKLLFIQIPESNYCKETWRRIKYTLFDNWVRSFEIEYLNFNSINKHYSDNYFFDTDHLNDAGANFFTAELAQEVVQKMAIKK